LLLFIAALLKPRLPRCFAAWLGLKAAIAPIAGFPGKFAGRLSSLRLSLQ